jgi:hypothetical protein
MAKFLCVERLGNQVHPIIQMVFPINDAVFQDGSTHIHKAGTVQSWFEEHEGKFNIFSEQQIHHI